jgi:hypothetical protein
MAYGVEYVNINFINCLYSICCSYTEKERVITCYIHDLIIANKTHRSIIQDNKIKYKY